MKTVVITGATGWIGSALINKLSQETQHKIVPISSSTKEIKLSNGKCIRAYSTSEAIGEISNSNDTELWHLAFLTKDKESLMSLETYISTNLSMRNDANRLIEAGNIKKMVYVSSGAVYSNNGTICTDISKNPYGTMKHQDEIFFMDLAHKNRISLIIPRVFGLLGEYINKHELYAVTNFILQAIKTDEIKINAKSRVFRSYIGVYELIEICSRYLNDIDNQKTIYTFDTANFEILELNDLAFLVSQILKKEISIIRKYDGSTLENFYIGNIANQCILTERYNIKLKSHKESIEETLYFINKQH